MDEQKFEKTLKDVLIYKDGKETSNKTYIYNANGN